MCLCVPVLAVLDALTQCGSLSERRVPTATSTSGQDAILDYYGGKKRVKILNITEMIWEAKQTSSFRPQHS